MTTLPTVSAFQIRSKRRKRSTRKNLICPIRHTDQDVQSEPGPQVVPSDLLWPHLDDASVVVARGEGLGDVNGPEHIGMVKRSYIRKMQAKTSQVVLRMEFGRSMNLCKKPLSSMVSPDFKLPRKVACLVVDKLRPDIMSFARWPFWPWQGARCRAGKSWPGSPGKPPLWTWRSWTPPALCSHHLRCIT